jgi:hypothetical protein
MKRPSPTNPFQADRVEATSFRPEWDVPSVNEGISRRVEEWIGKVRDRDRPEAGRKLRYPRSKHRGPIEARSRVS